MIAGLGIGLFSVFVAQVSDGHAFGPLALIRLVEAVLIGVVVLVTGAVWRPERRFVPAMAGVGVLDMAGNGFFILAVQGGALAVAAVLSSLYPVMTVILASGLPARAGHPDARRRDRPRGRRDRVHRGRDGVVTAP